MHPHPKKLTKNHEMRFTPNIETCIRRAGWFPGRQEPIEHEILTWYPPNHPVFGVLTEFGQLRILRSQHYTNEDYGGNVDIFGFSRVPEMVANLRSVEGILGKCLAFLGYVDAMEAIVMSDDKSILLSDGNNLCYWAPNFDDFLARVLVGNKRVPFPPEYTPGSWKW